MTVIVLTSVPQGLRGHLTRWLMEVAPGVYVGRVNSRVREALWGIVMDMVADGRALMVYSANNEQGLEVRNHRHSWHSKDLDGVTLMERPKADVVVEEGSRLGLRKAERYRRIPRIK